MDTPDATRRTIEYDEEDDEVTLHGQVELRNWNKPGHGRQSAHGPTLNGTSPLTHSSGAEQVAAPERLKTDHGTLPRNVSSGWTPDENAIVMDTTCGTRPSQPAVRDAIDELMLEIERRSDINRTMARSQERPAPQRSTSTDTRATVPHGTPALAGRLHGPSLPYPHGQTRGRSAYRQHYVNRQYYAQQRDGSRPSRVVDEKGEAVTPSWAPAGTHAPSTVRPVNRTNPGATPQV